MSLLKRPIGHNMKSPTTNQRPKDSITPQNSRRNPQPSTLQDHVPLESTNAEAFYYAKQITLNTPVVVALLDGEQITGNLEWYDRDCIKIRRFDRSAIIIQKRGIKYILKQMGFGWQDR